VPKGKTAFVVDGKQEQPYDAVLGFRFSPDVKRYAYVGVGGEAQGQGPAGGRRPAGPMFQEEEQQDWPGGVSKPAFSPGGSHVAYAACRTKDSVEEMVDHTPLPGLGLEAVSRGTCLRSRGRLALLGWGKKGGQHDHHRDRRRQEGAQLSR
jgi:hypothetical protein